CNRLRSGHWRNRTGRGLPTTGYRDRSGANLTEFPVISGLDHVVLLVEDIGKGTAAYQTLLGRMPSWRTSGDGADRVLFTLDNITLELAAPSGDGAAGDRIRDGIKGP